MRQGCLFLNNRYHDPQLGVFISVDPLIQQTGEPYLYASGNPTTLSDPTGLEPSAAGAFEGAALYLERDPAADWNLAATVVFDLVLPVPPGAGHDFEAAFGASRGVTGPAAGVACG